MARAVQAMAGAGEARPDGVDVRRFQARIRRDVHPRLEHSPVDTRGECFALRRRLVLVGVVDDRVVLLYSPCRSTVARCCRCWCICC